MIQIEVWAAREKSSKTKEKLIFNGSVSALPRVGDALVLILGGQEERVLNIQHVLQDNVVRVLIAADVQDIYQPIYKLTE